MELVFNRWFGFREPSTLPAGQRAMCRGLSGNRAAVKLPLALVLLALIPITAAGCSQWAAQKRPAYSTVPDEPNDDAERAKKLNREGLEKLARGKADAAEALFRDALAADVDYAPAHNNLGQIYLRRHQLYLAAWEFEFASSLMPERPECLVNLGLVYETANRLLDAQGAYEAALSVAPADVEALSNLARVSVKLDDDPSRIHYLLSEVVMRDSRPAWRKWAQDLIAAKYQLGGAPSSFGDPASHGENDVPIRTDGSTPVTPGLQLPLPRASGMKPEEMVPAPVGVAPDHGDASMRRGNAVELQGTDSGGGVRVHLSSPDSADSSPPTARTIDLSASELLPSLPAPSTSGR